MIACEHGFPNPTKCYVCYYGAMAGKVPKMIDIVWPTTTETPMSNYNMTRDQLAVSATEEDILAHRNLGIIHYGKRREKARYAYADAMIKAREGEHEFFKGVDSAKCAQATATFPSGWIVLREAGKAKWIAVSPTYEYLSEAEGFVADWNRLGSSSCPVTVARVGS